MLLSLHCYIIAVKNRNKLNVVDFGGSLGSTWYQVRDFIPAEIAITWSIVEQTACVQEGKKHFVDDVLDFYFTIDDCLVAKKNINVVLLSSVIQYLEKSHVFLDQLTNYQIDHLLFDRKAFINEAQYSAWFFNEAEFLRHLQYVNGL